MTSHQTSIGPIGVLTLFHCSKSRYEWLTGGNVVMVKETSGPCGENLTIPNRPQNEIPRRASKNSILIIYIILG